MSVSQLARINDPDGVWSFLYDPAQKPQRSSRRKELWRGTCIEWDRGSRIAAYALAFRAQKNIDAHRASSSDIAEFFGTECNMLGRLDALGAGPRMLGIACVPIGDESTPLIIEEDAGKPLNELLAISYEAEPSTALHRLGTPERKRENDKILFDIYSQLINVHAGNLYHRDLTLANVCVRRFGPKPEDVRATLIDFELGSPNAAGSPRARKPLYHTLFVDIPARLWGSGTGTLALRPNALEVDLAYLAALRYALERSGTTILEMTTDPYLLDDFIGFVQDEIPYFGYGGDGTLKIRRLSVDADLKPLAQSLGLVPATPTDLTGALDLAGIFQAGSNVEETAQSAFLGSIAQEVCELAARRFHRYYLDAQNLAELEASNELQYYRRIGAIAAASFEGYKALRRSQNKEVEYDSFFDQPSDLQYSGYDSARHALVKVEALGYTVKPEREPAMEAQRVRSLTDDQLEFLARLEHARWIEERKLLGWTYAPGPKDVAKKTSPYFVPYDELSEDMKEYDRSSARNLIDNLEFAGLMVIREG